MNLRKTATAFLVAAGLAFGFSGVTPVEAKGRKVVVKHKRKHHRHRVGIKHIGRGTKVKTTVKTSPR